MYRSAPIENQILSLPGWSRPLPSKQYSGFVDASVNGTVKMHYWFVESENDPKNSPLVLWFNGGPGASSLYGLFVELGPFILSDLSYEGPIYAKTSIPQLIYNPYGWQKVANLLFLSMPPPVGFSYCDPVGPAATGNDCGAWNDTTTGEVTYYAIKSWLDTFSEYKTNQMFILGESYAGVYIPMIIKSILAGQADYNINLVGFGVGDACTPPDICGDKETGPYWYIQFLFGKGAFSIKLYEEINTVCTHDELIKGKLSTICSNSVNKIEQEAGGYWVYGFYDNCWYENPIRRKRARRNLLSNYNNHFKSSSSKERKYFGPPIISTADFNTTLHQEIMQTRKTKLGKSSSLESFTINPTSVASAFIGKQIYNIFFYFL